MKCSPLVLLLAISCGQKAEKKAADDKPVEPIGSAAAPKPVAPEPVSDRDKVAVINAANVGATELQFSAPTGDKIALAAVKRLDGTAWKVDVVIAGKVVETIDEGVAKDDPKLEPLASVVRFANAAVLVAGSRTLAAPRAYTFDARLFGWDAATKQLVVTKKVQFPWSAPVVPEEVPE